MSNINKQTVQAVADLKAGYTLGHADIAMLKSMARQLLAGLEQEPVYQVLSGDAWVDLSKGAMESQARVGATVRILYAAPQLPQPTVDQKAVESLATDLMKRIDKITGERHSVATLSSLRVSIVEACRAAMLQGAEPVQEWIPCSERMPGETQPVIVVSGEGVVQRTVYQFCDGVWSDWYDQYEDVNVDAFTHWMPLPAAPQQGVKK